MKAVIIRSVFKTPRAIFRRVGIASVVAALTVGTQPVVWAICADGTTFPAGGYVVGQPPLPTGPDNWSPGIFTGTKGSVSVPELSVNEHNTTAEPLTHGFHNWVFDQGSTTCKETDIGIANGAVTSWSIPAVNPTECISLPVIRGGRVVGVGDVPGQGDAITPTCSVAQLNNPATNTYFNQLGCAIVASNNGGIPVDTDAAHATTYMFVAGIKGGLFSVSLDNVPQPAPPGTEAGKTSGPQNYYSAIPEGQKLDTAAISKDGRIALATSTRRLQTIFGCLNPLGDPGNPALGVNDPKFGAFFVPPGNTVRCMQVGSNNLAVNLTTAFAADNQPYFGGQRVINSFNTVPGGPSVSAWPQCVARNNPPATSVATVGLAAALADAFQNNRSNGCGNAQPNFGFTSANIIQPSSLMSHGQYLYTAGVAQPTVQFKVTVNPVSGLSQYKFRTYLSGTPLVTGHGVAEDLLSLIVYSDKSGIGAAGQEALSKIPLCEDM
jgi:hypothetical protein